MSVNQPITKLSSIALTILLAGSLSGCAKNVPIPTCRDYAQMYAKNELIQETTPEQNAVLDTILREHGFEVSHTNRTILSARVNLYCRIIGNGAKLNLDEQVDGSLGAIEDGNIDAILED